MTDSFDLRDEPWIQVRRRQGSEDLLSLRQVLAQSSSLSAITGELPTQSVAVLRLLLAVLHRAFADELRRDPVHAWSRLWTGELSLVKVDAYLDRYGDRFDLISERAPFLQVPDLRVGGDRVSPLTSLIADVPNNEPFFTIRQGAGVASIDFAEAARWVVHAHAYDPSGIKSGADGDPRVKNRKGYPIGVAWAGTLGAIVAEGRTLRETLLLNLVPVTHNGDAHSARDTAVWERPPLAARPEDRPGAPYGPADLLTWPSRRIRLIHDGHRVTGVVLCNGDPLAQQNQFAETMTGWRRSEAQEKKLGRVPVYMPRTHDPERALWRGLTGLLAQGPSRAGGKDAPADIGPMVLHWLRLLLDDDDGVLDQSQLVRTRAVGILYGSNNSVVAEVIDDALGLPALLLTNTGSALRDAALQAAQAAEQAAAKLANLAGDLASAAGGDPKGPRDRARGLLLQAIDVPYRRWLAGLNSSTDALVAREAFERQVYEMARCYADELLATSPPSALAGREVRNHVLNTPIADLRFRAALRTALPLAVTPGDTAAGPHAAVEEVST